MCSITRFISSTGTHEDGLSRSDDIVFHRQGFLSNAQSCAKGVGLFKGAHIADLFKLVILLTVY